jgi:hypothetical protein
MSITAFKHSYKNSNIKQLRTYITLPKLLATKKFVTYTEASFIENREVYNILVLIIFNQYDLNRIISDIIDRDNVDLLEDILSNNYDVELDEDLILKTVANGRVTMAKAIYEYIYDVKKNSYSVIKKLLNKYDFIYNADENSIDSFILAIKNRRYDHAEKIISHINLGFWNNFSIKYACDNSMVGITKRLLSFPEIDPGVSNNYPLKIAMKNSLSIANELLKHPLVIINFISSYFVDYIIGFNCLCVAKKILRSDNKDAKALFKTPDAINLMINYHNDVTYLAIKLRIFDVSELINFWPEQEINIKKYSASLKIDKEYVYKPYEFNLDPIDIFKKSLEDDDIDLAKSIKNYPISINIDTLLRYLHLHSSIVTEYIYDEILIEYDPNALIVSALSKYMATRIFNSVVNHPNLDFVKVYICNNYGIQDIVLKYVKKKYSEIDYKKFRKSVGL